MKKYRKNQSNYPLANLYIGLVIAALFLLYHGAKWVIDWIMK